MQSAFTTSVAPKVWYMSHVVLGPFCAAADTPADATEANAGPTLPNPAAIPEFAHHAFQFERWFGVGWGWVGKKLCVFVGGSLREWFSLFLFLSALSVTIPRRHIVCIFLFAACYAPFRLRCR